MDQPLRPIVAEAAGGTRSGVQLYSSPGVCVETLATPSSCDPEAPDPCGAGAHCGAAGTCQRTYNSCASIDECPPGETMMCSAQIATTGGADRDLDGVVDSADNCPDDTNSDQEDLDGDQIGDECDRYICGDGQLDGSPGEVGAEECEPPAVGTCDAHCRRTTPECADGVDNDGDALTDFPTDPGCASAGPSALEAPQCSNGRDDDFDDQIDLADAKCKSASDNDEQSNPPKKTCGLGGELLLALIAVRAMKRRRGRAPSNA
jgi:hypothetical protein